MAEQRPVEELLNQGIQAARAQQRDQARTLLMQVVEQDPYSEQAWLWLSGVMDDPRDMQVALANALTINPANEKARQGLDMLRQRHGNLLEPGEEPPSPTPQEAEVPTLDEDLPPGARGEEIQCYACGAAVYDVADFCWQCHAVVHCCENCVHRRETACKEKYGVRGPAAAVTRNDCPEWTPIPARK